MISKSIFLAALGGGLALTAPTGAQARKADREASGIVDAMIACANIAGKDERFACYEARVADLRRAREQVARLFVPPKTAPQEEFKPFSSTVASVTPLEPGSWLMVLADRSVWRTADVVRVVPERGSSIRVEKGAFGSFLASIDGHGVRVKRLR